MASILLGIDDPQAARELLEVLQGAGHRVAVVAALDTTPGPARATPDVILVDGDAPGMDVAVVAAAWRRREPPPGLVVLGATSQSRTQAERVHARLIAKPPDPEQLVAELARLIHGGTADKLLNPERALATLGLESGGLPDDAAVLIVKGSRTVDIPVVREALRAHMYDYATRTFLVDRLLQRRALTAEEGRLAMSFDGGRTVRGGIDGLPRAADDRTPLGALASHQSARLVWALAASGAITLSPEPPATHPTARLRQHLRARKVAFNGATHYSVLELGIDATLVDIERAADLAEMRYGPATLNACDLGDLAGVAAAIWEQIAGARLVLGDARLRADYDAALVPRHSELEALRLRRRADTEEAERAFHRGQHALAAGDVFKAVSELAGAARKFPGNPDYEAYVAWVRFLGEDERQPAPPERKRLAERERNIAETALRGRRVWPRAQCAIGLLCEAAGDASAARAYLKEALRADERLGVARQALARMRG